MAEEAVKLYPNCDPTVWLRSCEEEVNDPVEGTVTGEIPAWLNGCLIRNGPGSLKVGDMTFRHLFDSAALLHRFSVSGGGCSYQCRFLRSRTFQRNRAAARIVVTEFGTRAAPDPCHTIFDRVSALFRPGESMSDNAMISVYPFGDELYAFTEGPVIHRIDPVTLDTCERKNLMESNVALVNHTSHPHVMPNGDVFNVGMSVVRGRIRHVVVKFPFVEKGDMFENAQIVGSIKPRWALHPAYMHTFGVTANYFVIVEQPLTVSLCALVRNQLQDKPLASSLKWFADQETHIVLISRADGTEHKRYRTESLFFLHIVNAYELGDELVLDLCTYRDPQVLNAMYVDAMENMQSNADYAEWFRGRPKRLRLPLQAPRLAPVAATLLADVGCETPTIHYAMCNGRPYRYFYAISSDVDAENPGTLIKVDTKTGEMKTWCEKNCYPSEPVFVPAPGGTEEDSGVLLCALVWGGARDRETGLLVLSAASMEELGRAVFATPSPAPKCLHGWFLPQHT
ncbi:carotenoid isomerooxygenase [Plutella xylostella]|uniref:carotenoid isomerooxygenase n=1 Tax=Plutella xylostella TaxID=51655 RepID=UPI00203257F7|nr:carotenoid isomerooxygenase [Plutella xylostella]XP_048480734.1 carotenoid isomerooxygenase [Plutella xylostella]XP_048480735.1 carotenoid isomerooxygenase [Plutella xylostella]